MTMWFKQANSFNFHIRVSVKFDHTQKHKGLGDAGKKTTAVL